MNNTLVDNWRPVKVVKSIFRGERVGSHDSSEGDELEGGRASSFCCASDGREGSPASCLWVLLVQ